MREPARGAGSLPAVENTAEHIPAESVRAEQMSRPGGAEAALHVLFQRVIPGNERRKGGRRDDESQKDGRRDRRPGEPPTRVLFRDTGTAPIHRRSSVIQCEGL